MKGHSNHLANSLSSYLVVLSPHLVIPFNESTVINSAVVVTSSVILLDDKLK